MRKIKTIALVAPSGNIRDFKDLNSKIQFLEKNFKIKKFYNETKSAIYLSDSDENRIKFLEQAFCDDEVDLVLSVRGGFGALRILDKINFEKIKNCDKFYAGSSDATILLSALSNKTKIKCFHSLMMTNGFVENLEQNIKIIENDIFDIKLKPLKKGKLKGVLWGGNLSSIVSMLSNSAYEPNQDIILFLEDLNEPLYKIDKMIYEIYRSKIKSKIKGLIFGDFYLEDDDVIPLFKNYAELFNVAAYSTTDITHKMNNITIPYLKAIDLF